MTTTAEPRPDQEGAARGSRVGGALDRARGIELLGDLDGSGHEGGAALVRRADGQMVQLPPRMYALLDCVDGRRDPRELAACLSERLGKRFREEHVLRLAQKLAAQGLLAGTEDNAPERRDPLLGLRCKVLVTNPSITGRLTRPFTFLFRPWLVWPVLALFAGVLWFVLVEKGVASATSEAFGNPELLLLVFLLAIGSAGFHEIGHAAACRYSGGKPGGMGMGLYMVWPAFYTDVTDAYRLARRDRLRVDLGGLYFNALVAVATVAVWFAWRADALLLLVALQLIQMVKQLSPVIRADGYHILSDLTGVPDLYAHIGPTLRRLLFWRKKEPSALTGRARLIVTLWVLVVVPALLALALGAILLLPRLLATAWASGREITSSMPDAGAVGIVTALLQLLALALPVLGAVVLTYSLSRAAWSAAKTWSSGRPIRQGVLATAATCAASLMAWAWWPAGQYEPIRAQQDGTLLAFVHTLSSPQTAARPAPAASRLEPGTYLAIAMIPEGGATDDHPAFVVIRGDDGDEPVVLLSHAISDEGEPIAADGETEQPTAPASTTTEAAPTTNSAAAPAGTSTTTVPAVALPFRLPGDPGPGGTQAVAVGTRAGAVTYKVAYALVTVRDGDPVTNTNSAFAFGHCNACTTVAVSVQIVLVIGSSNVIAPINAAGALNVECPACVTTAIARQLVVTLTREPPEELRARLEAALRELDALSTLGRDMPAVLAEVVEIETRIREELEESGLLARPSPPPAPGTSTSTSGSTAGGTTTPVTSTSTSSTTTAPPTQTTEPAAATTTAPPSTTETTTTTTTATTTTATTTDETEAPPPPAEAPPPGTTTSG